MKQDLLRAVINDGYGLKGKSRWVSDAIQALYTDPSWVDQVVDGDLGGINDETDSVYLSAEDRAQLQRKAREAEGLAQKMAEDVAEKMWIESKIKSEPAMMDVSLASVMRAAIARRLYALGMKPIPPMDGTLSF